MTREHVCVDCRAQPDPPATPRPAPHGGPRSRRCATHHRARREALRSKARTNHKNAWFGLDADTQAALWEFQGSRCPCGSKVSPVVPSAVHTDHDHNLAVGHDHPPHRGCIDCVTGYLCAACNREIVGRLTGRHGRAGAALALRRLADFLEDPPLARMRRQLEDGAA